MGLQLWKARMTTRMSVGFGKVLRRI